MVGTTELKMSKLGTHAIRKLAKQIVASNPGGIRYADLVRTIVDAHPDTPTNTINGSVWDLATRFPNEITKPTRGLFRPASAENGDQEPSEKIIGTSTSGKPVREKDFYEPFAEWLKNDLDEVAAVTALGGGGLKAKWGTPDVVGVYKPLASNLIRFPLEIVSAEVKIDAQGSVVAFGQAIAYRLFSTKSYLVMPSSISPEDLSRLEALSMLFGLGLVVFDVDCDSPNFGIRVRAQRFSPDMFYVNEFADRLRSHNPTVFEELFA